jgi:hypothetical protein
MLYLSSTGVSLLKRVHDPSLEAATMAEPSQKTKESEKPKTEAEKKQPETVLLTSEELRTIAGGATIVPPPPPKHGH